MKKGVLIIGSLTALGLMEWFSWQAFQLTKQKVSPLSEPDQQVEDGVSSKALPIPEEPQTKSVLTSERGVATSSGLGNFPAPTVQAVNGRSERTIHIGVRQYVWEPSTLNAKQGELVRLIVHNADIKHGIAIPELGVNQDIISEGAVIEFMASKVGTFDFFCSVWCGEGHMEMRGQIVIEP